MACSRGFSTPWEPDARAASTRSIRSCVAPPGSDESRRSSRPTSQEPWGCASSRPTTASVATPTRPSRRRCAGSRCGSSPGRIRTARPSSCETPPSKSWPASATRDRRAVSWRRRQPGGWPRRAGSSASCAPRAWDQRAPNMVLDAMATGEHGIRVLAEALEAGRRGEDARALEADGTPVEQVSSDIMLLSNDFDPFHLRPRHHRAPAPTGRAASGGQ